MKKIFIYGLLALSTCAALSSCEDMFGDFLDKQPSNELTGEQVFSSWALAEYFHFDTYQALPQGRGRINNSWLDSATDLGETSFATGGTRTTFNIGNYYGSAGEDELSDVWTDSYNAIRKCNMTLARLDGVPKASDLSDALYQQQKTWYKAEARFFRAFFYWEMFLRYGPVPIITDVLNPEDDIISGYTTRPSTKEYVVNFILKELEECEPLLMKYSEATGTNASKISQPMASALRCRIMLYMASPRYSSESGITWQQAADAAKDFITKYGANYGLMTRAHTGATNYVDNLTYVWLRTPYSDKNNEIIFYRNASASSWNAIYRDVPVGDGGNGGMCPSQNLVDMYDMIDGTSPFTEYDATGAPVYHNGVPTVNAASGYSDQKMWENRDPRLDATVLYQGVQWGNNVGPINVILGQKDNPVGNANATPTGYYMRKYIPVNIINNNHVGSTRIIWTYIRYAEILMNYAEALNEIEGPTDQVCELLDQVRHRAGITGNVADRADLKTKDAMRNFIHKERTVEFAFEEQRSWDVRRWNVAVEALGRPIYGIDVNSDGSISRKTAQERVFEQRMYLYPLPESEYWKTGISNNSGWTN